MTTDDSGVAGDRSGAFTSILVPVDGSPESERAIVYAARLDADRIVLLRVIGGDPPSGGTSPLDIFTGWRREKIEGVAQELERLAQKHATAARTVETAIRYGNPAALIIAEAEHHDLVVMSSQGRGSAGRRMFGSIADRVMRHGSTPTLVVRTYEQTGNVETRRIVVPLDGSGLAENALPVATRLARQLDVPMHLVRVVGMGEILGTVRARRKVEGVEADRIRESDPYEVARSVTEAEATTYLDTVAERLRKEGFPVTVEMRGGTPAFELAWTVTQDDLVVMTSRGQGGYQRWLVGSVAEKLVREAKAPVLLVPIHRQEPAAS